jgi:hypothetical protein
LTHRSFFVSARRTKKFLVESRQMESNSNRCFRVSSVWVQRDFFFFFNNSCATAQTCAAESARVVLFFFFFFFSFFTVNREQLGRRPVPPPTANYQKPAPIADARLPFGGRIRRERNKGVKRNTSAGGAINFANFLISTAYFGKTEATPSSLVDRDDGFACFTLIGSINDQTSSSALQIKMAQFPTQIDVDISPTPFSFAQITARDRRSRHPSQKSPPQVAQCTFEQSVSD